MMQSDLKVQNQTRRPEGTLAFEKAFRVFPFLVANVGSTCLVRRRVFSWL